jgi:argininosuccinate synthase
LIEFAKAHNIDVEHTTDKSYSTDDNIAYLSSEAGILEEIETETPEHVFKLVPQPYDKKVSNTPQYINLHFKSGVPCKLEIMDEKNKDKVIKTVTAPIEIFTSLNELGIKHAIGNSDVVETRVNGLKNHGVYQNPGLSIIYACHTDMEHICLDKEILKLQHNLANELSYIVYEGF